jgi:hypothetical protein
MDRSPIRIMSYFRLRECSDLRAGLSGHVYSITDPQSALLPIAVSGEAPTSGYDPRQGCTVNATYLWELDFPLFPPL